MFRRFRQRRALRAIEKNQKLHQQKLQQLSKQSGSSTTSRPIDTIFRSVDSTTTFQNITSTRTAGSSFGGEEEENRLAPSVSTTPTTESPISSITCSSFAKGILVDANDDDRQKQECMVVDISNSEALQQMVVASVEQTKNIIPATKHKRSSSFCTSGASSCTKPNLRNVLDEIQNEIFVSEQMKEEILMAQIQLAFFKESYGEVQKELQQKDSTMQRQQLELLMSRKIITYITNELSATKAAFQESVSSLVEMKLLLLSLQEQLKKQNDDIRAKKQTFIP